MSFELPKAIEAEVRAIPDDTRHAEAVRMVTDIVVRHHYSLEMVERCFVEASLAFSAGSDANDPWHMGEYDKGGYEAVVWGMALKGLRERAAKTVRSSSWFVADAMELRRRGRFEFVAIDIGDGFYNVRGPSIDGRGYDRNVRAETVGWIVEDLNAAIALGTNRTKVPRVLAGVYHCPCGRCHARGPVNGVNVYRCMGCGETRTVAAGEIKS